MTPTISFYGGAGTVTGSKFLVEANETKVLMDCGLFQGFKQLRKRNRARLDVDLQTLDAIILTHAHIDHSGYIPVLVKNGFKGPIICTGATADLCSILLPDSGYLQEREAEYNNRHEISKHKPDLPLYGVKDAQIALKQFAPYPFEESIDIREGVTVRFRRAGHILGAAIVELKINGKTIVFSGDLGRPNDLVMLDPAIIETADYLVVESTYGDTKHDKTDPETGLAEVIDKTVKRGGTVVIPSFAVGRAQALLYHIHRLKKAGRLQDIPVFLDSPMAVNATNIYRKHTGDHKLSVSQCTDAFNVSQYINTVEDSKDLTRNQEPKVIISASGMATGGRVIHHLKSFITDEKNTILFVGYQAGGTRGEALINGADKIKIHGEYHPVRAEIAKLDMLSAHADSDEIMSWLAHFKKPPRTTFIVHGEPKPADALRLRIEEKLKWIVEVPEHNSTHDLS